LSFQSQRRNFNEVAAKAGLKTYGYLFTEPQPGSGQLGVFHGSEIAFVYGNLIAPTQTSLALSSIMMEYWISFATSLDPNDGLGVPRPLWEQYTTAHPALMQLNGANLTMIPDDYRKEQIAFINGRTAVFHSRRQVK
ncbi:Lipase 2, partial [Termitomyces sp. T112]